MNRCFKKDNQYHELSERTRKAADAVFSPEQIEELSVRGVRSFSARFIVAGPVGYQEQNDITYISPEVLYRVAPTLVNRAVIASPHDLNITAENIMQKAKGRVVDVWKAETEDAWFARFEIWDEDLLKDIDNGKYAYVSCAYFITQDGGAFRYNGIDCTTTMLDGFMHHLCITDSPRFNDTEIWRFNEDKKLLNNFKIGDIIKFNEEPKKTEKEQTMGLKKILGFRINETEFNDDLKFKTDAGTMSVSDMIAKINEDKQTIENLNAEIAQKDEEISKLQEKPTEEDPKDNEPEDKSKEPSTVFADKKTAADKDAVENGSAIKDAIPEDGTAKTNEDGVVSCSVKARGSMIKSK